MNIAQLLPIIVALPLAAAATSLLLGRRPKTQIVVTLGTLLVVLGIGVATLVAADHDNVVSIVLGGWQAPWGISLVADRLSALLVVVATTMLLGVLVYAIGQGITDGDAETPVTIFQPTYLVLAAGLFNAFLAGDLFNMFVGFEIMLAASYVLITLGGTGPRIRSGVIYIVVSLVSSVFFLVAIALLYGATGTVNMAQLAQRIPELPAETQTIVHLSLLLGFCIKAAVFPLSFWLPDSYPTAPAPVTAVFAGLLTKVGVYAIIRTETLLFAHHDVSAPLMTLAFFTLLIGIMGAIAQADIRRLLSFTLVSHIGYMLFGIALGTQAGIAATIYYMVHHITVQTTLFLAVGLVERVGGTTSLTRLSGVLNASPLISALFLVPALNLGGIPPFSGFIGKLALILAGVQTANWLTWVVIGAMILTSLLTLYPLARVWNLGFWRPAIDPDRRHSRMLRSLQENPLAPPRRVAQRDVSKLMISATAGMVVLTLALTVFAGPLLGFADRAATTVADPLWMIATLLGPLSGGAA
ncbi:Na+/H+ antiporter subunit D [Pseudoclavibacter sp. CFCC 11306]|uniref:Na+/H+ antiporter subunit D n=1 Tax=Pseudoclavibacter sp. CFCC 11306 TaxID=1564493 RepID=UPI001300D3F2|nr:Na+/H+ antiporter subunit D [Pseudoclavibacter sp. CFCC 11306]KAB1658268.1 Na+/H+ antiporter subunit D [Pseudoclavibacter sp. CFCC 11306]